MSTIVTHAGPIVVATAGDDSPAAIAVARQLAAADGRDVSVISAVELPVAVWGLEPMPIVPDLVPYVDRQRARVELQLAGTPTADWSVDLVLDDAAHAIADAARARHASLVVLGSGRHDIAARLFGETALRTIKRVSCPVLVVPATVANATDIVPARLAIAAVDFSDSSLIAARAALDLVAPNGTLHLVHVAVDQAHVELMSARLVDVERLIAAEVMERNVDITVLATTLVGDPCDALVTFAQTHGATLIAAGRQQHGMLDLLFVGRVTTALVRQAPCSVLVTPAPSPTA